MSLFLKCYKNLFKMGSCLRNVRVIWKNLESRKNVMEKVCDYEVIKLW